MAVANIRDGGIRRRIAIDADEFEVGFESFNADPTPLETIVQTIDGGSKAIGLYPGAGHARLISSFTFSISHALLTGDALQILEEVRESGDWHWFGTGKMIPAFYAAAAGQVRFYLPKKRRDAVPTFGWLAAQYPIRVWVDGVEMVAAKILRKTLAQIDAGPIPADEVWFSDVWDATGHTPFDFGTAFAGGEVIKIHYPAAFRVRHGTASMGFRTTAESRSTQLIEQ